MKTRFVKEFGIGVLLMCCWSLATNVALAGGGGGGGGGRAGGAAGGGGFGGGAGTAAGASSYATGTRPGAANIIADQENRKIIAMTDERTAQAISNVLAALVRPAPQVLIKVVFVEASYNKGLDFGVDGGFSQNTSPHYAGIVTNITPNLLGTGLVTNFLGRKPTVVGGANSFAGLAGLTGLAPSDGGIYSILGADYQATLHAIATAGKAEILSRPSILARNNQPATISLGKLVPIITGTTVDSFGNNHNTLTYQTVGISLTVTPFIMSDGMVEMAVTPTTSQLAPQSEWVPISTGIASPVIDSRSADTVVVVPDGMTVTIGGLMQKSTQKAESKIPLLGDIPLLGTLFKRSVNSDAKSELLIFLTPYVVKSPTQLAELSANEKSKTDPALIPHGLSDRQFNRYLNGNGVQAKESDSAQSQEGRDDSGYLAVPPPSKPVQP
jgi:general secretion pathway protein D